MYFINHRSVRKERSGLPAHVAHVFGPENVYTYSGRVHTPLPENTNRKTQAVAKKHLAPSRTCPFFVTRTGRSGCRASAGPAGRRRPLPSKESPNPRVHLRIGSLEAVVQVSLKCTFFFLKPAKPSREVWRCRGNSSMGGNRGPLTPGPHSAPGSASSPRARTRGADPAAASLGLCPGPGDGLPPGEGLSAGSALSLTQAGHENGGCRKRGCLRKWVAQASETAHRGVSLALPPRPGGRVSEASADRKRQDRERDAALLTPTGDTGKAFS